MAPWQSIYSSFLAVLCSFQRPFIFYFKSLTLKSNLCVSSVLIFFATSSTQTAKLCWPVTSSLTHLKYYTVFILFFQVQFSKEQDSFQSQLQNQTLSCKSSVSHLVSVINKDVNLYRAGDFLALIWPGWSLAQVMRRAQVMRQRLPSTRLLSEETWRTLVECFWILFVVRL